MKPILPYLLCFALGGPLSGLAQNPAPVYFPNEKADTTGKALRLRAEQAQEHAAKLYDRGQYRSALYYLNQLVELRPQDKTIWLGRGQCREETQDLQGAIEDYTEALRLDEKFTEALFNRAMLHYQMEKFGFAITDFTQLLAIPGAGPTNVVYYGSSASNPPGAVSHLVTMPNRLAPIYHYLGLCKLKTTDYAGALADFDQALALAPKEATYWVNRGLARVRLGQHTEAMADFHQALLLEPDNSHALYNLSLIDPTSAKTVEAYDKVIGQNESFAPAYVNRGQARFAQGNFAGALADFNQAVALGHREYETYLNRALAKSRLKDHVGAVKDFGRAINREPRSAKAYSGRASAYFHLKNFVQALADYNLAIAFSPQESHLYYNRGLVYHQQKQRNQACADWQKAIQLGSSPAELTWEKFCR
jgi:tetratricopeptide (TPR) repeat protein